MNDNQQNVLRLTWPHNKKKTNDSKYREFLIILYISYIIHTKHPSGLLYKYTELLIT